MRKRFATRDSSGPKVANFQLTFWRLALKEFERIIDNWKKYALREGEEADYSLEYDEDDFVIDAAITLVLAGTSVAELLGQNVPPQGDRTPHLRSAYRNLIKDPIPDDIEEFFAVYDSLRHLGPAKYDKVEDITPDKLCKYLNIAQSIWHDVLKIHNATIGQDFLHEFVFPE
ncbi:hypothetical protein HNR65_002691 [Desulfosalsimonas propionicica]|uniref:Uncharacterized protein n=1 Tax=Desulfosalsimonas propionicica TaxID=332175 RepID=A0A7W0HLH5_9BACT|nr:hypothetical protein [Desulfosalsimonas propionicica]MBA2882349.1 hypothetical protein [Desulfosalsimonas propionicica]